MATSPFELTATPDTSPTFMSAGSFRKFTLPSNGISGTAWAYAGLMPCTTPASATRAMTIRFMCPSLGIAWNPTEKPTGSISLVIEAAHAISSPLAHQRLRAVGGDAARVRRDLSGRRAALPGRGADLRGCERDHPTGHEDSDVPAHHRDAGDIRPGGERSDAVAD